MMFPLFLILVLGICAIFIGGCFIYIQLYKRRVNKILNGATKKIMPAPFHVAIALLIVVLVFAIFISFVSGFGLAYRSPKSDGQINITAFYGEIISIDENLITVKGLSINEKDYRDEFTLELHESVIVEWKKQPIEIDELQKGDLIVIILVTDVAGIEDIFKIQLLKD